MVKFKKNKHTYKGTGGKYLSVTKFIEEFYPEFNEQWWLDYKACEALEGGLIKIDGKYTKVKGFYKKVLSKGLNFYLHKWMHEESFHLIRTEIENSWKKKNKTATNKGSEYHKQKEDKAFESGITILDNKQIKVIPKPKFIDCDNEFFPITEDGCYPEYLVFNDKWKLAGQIDRLFIKNKFATIRDYKTNEKLNFDGFNGEMMKYPFNHIPNCNFGHYTVQLSTYGVLLEELGFNIDNLAIDYYDKVIPVNYEKDAVLIALKEKRETL